MKGFVTNTVSPLNPRNIHETTETNKMFNERKIKDGTKNVSFVSENLKKS